MNRNETILSITDLSIVIERDTESILAVDSLSLDIPRGSTTAIVGESGSGKTLTALSTMGILPSPPAKITSGSIMFEDQDLLTLTERQMRRIRGDRIAMIFQEPVTSLNPVMAVGTQIGEAIRIHNKLDAKNTKSQVLALMEMVGIPDHRRRYRSYPHQLSGGIRQRVVIAMALARRPDLLVADEPTSALDTTIQAQIVDLLRRLIRDLGMSVLLITHDLGVVSALADRVVVLHKGLVMEEGSVRQVVKDPLHPYTQELLAARSPTLKPLRRGAIRAETNQISPNTGCFLENICQMRSDRCTDGKVHMKSVGEGRRVRCLALDKE